MDNNIATNTVIWAAGIKGNVPEGIDKNLIVRGNRIKTDRHCRVEGYNNIYAIGDLAYMETPKVSEWSSASGAGGDATGGIIGRKS